MKKNTKVLYIDGDLLAPSMERILPQTKQNYYYWTDFLEGKYTKVEDVIYQTPYKNLDVIYSPPPEVGKSFLSEKNANWWVNALKTEMLCRDRWFNELGYDYVILDNQNGISMNSANNITASDIGFLILRPVTYGVSGTTHLVKEMYRTIHGIRERQDFLIWNQIPRSVDDSMNEKIDKLLVSWDEYFRQIQVEPIAKIFYNADLSIAMLEEPKDTLIGITEFIQKHIEAVLTNVGIFD